MKTKAELTYKLEDGQVYMDDGKIWLYTEQMGTLGPFESEDKAMDKCLQYFDWVAAMDAN